MRHRSRPTVLFTLCVTTCGVLGAAFPLAVVADDTAQSHATEGDEGTAIDHVEGDSAGHGHDHGPHVGEDVDPGTKDIVMDFRSDLAIFTAIIFLLLFAGLKFLVWPKITAALDQRAAVIQQGFADAESARQQAMALLKEHQGRMEAIEDDVKAIIAEARRDAERTKADIIAAAESEAETIKDRALHDIGRAKDQALNELFQQMAEQVAGATEHVLGKGVSLADQQALIDEALREFASHGA